jgi:hypothetical protein
METQKNKPKMPKRDELGRFLTKKANPGRPGRKPKPKPPTPEQALVDLLKAGPQSPAAMNTNPLFKTMTALKAALKVAPLDVIQQQLEDEVSILATISDGILNRALADGEIFNDEGRVKSTLKDKNWLAFSTAKRQAAGQLLKVIEMRERREAEEKRKKAVVEKDDIDILME